MPDSAARRGPLYLTDAKLERSEVVEHLLDIIYTFENKYVGSRLFAVIDLAEKWDFAQVLHTIRRDLSNLDARADTFLRFQLSIKLKEPRAIANCLRRRHSVAWRDIRGDPQANRFVSYQTTRSVYDEAAPKLLDEDFIGGNRVFDVATWSYGSFLLTPPTVLWTLLRATHVGTTSPAQIDHDKVADEFERLLTLACECFR